MKTIKTLALAALAVLASVFPFPAWALSPASDTISVSWPSFPSNHTIRFLAHKAIPPGGRILITPASSDFSIPPGFDYRSFDLATSSSPSGPFSDRSIAALASAFDDSVLVSAIGAGTSTLEQITVNLASASGIATGTYVLLKIGTNAVYGATGTDQILNALAAGTQLIEIETRNAQDRTLEKIGLAVAMVEPVWMGAYSAKIRSSGKPSGILAFGTSNTQMSLNTNYRADCRYSLYPDTDYDLMTNTFTFTGAYFHSIIISGLMSGNSYSYYIRCRDQFGIKDDSDYLIEFEISGQAGEEGAESGTPGAGGGGAGGGGGGGSGPAQGRDVGTYLPYPPPPGSPGVALSGWGYPGREVTILKDGVEAGKAVAGANAAFGAFVAGLGQGVYTFSLWTSDADQNRSSTFSTTFWIDDGTQTNVADIILSPTMTTSRSRFDAGETIALSGYSVPGKKVEIWLYPRSISSPSAANANISTVIVAENGRYSASLNTAGLLPGEYLLKAKAVVETIGESGFSPAQALAIGQSAEVPGLCQGADLNGDGRVNLTDFSILLYFWGSNDQCADQNKDGTVNLTDFSIMMFYWTG